MLPRVVGPLAGPSLPLLPIWTPQTMDLLRISATSHGLNYLPEYHAAATGGFARRGLEVAAWARDPWTGTLDDLAAGEADLVLGGIWVPAMYAGAGRDLVAVGQLNARFPMVIVTREPVADFTWSWLTGRTVLAPGAGGTAPYEFTAGVMREHGVDPGAVRFVRDLSTEMLRELFEHGAGDAMTPTRSPPSRCAERGRPRGAATGRGRRADAQQRLLHRAKPARRAARPLRRADGGCE